MSAGSINMIKTAICTVTCEHDELKIYDLSKLNSLNDIGIFDNILINHYRLNKDQLAEIENHLSDNEILFICGFGHKNI